MYIQRHNIFGLVCLLGIVTDCAFTSLAEGLPADIIRFEAEDMTAESSSWVVKDHYRGWYGGVPLGYRMLNGAGGKAGKAVKEVTIPEGGKHRFWVRYLDILKHRGLFKVSIVQNGRIVAEKVFDTKSLRNGKEGKDRWGDGFAQWVWDFMDAELSAGPCVIELAKEGTKVVYGQTRSVDSFVITPDLSYVPRAEDFYPPLYVRFIFSKGQATPCAIHIWGRRPAKFQGSYFTGHHNVTRKGLLKGAWGGVKTNDFFHPGDTSEWVNLSQMLNLIGNNRIQFTAMVKYLEHVPETEFTVQLSRTPSEKGLLKSFSRSGPGAGIILVVDLSKPEEARSDTEWSRICREQAEKLADRQGKRPVKFPIITGCGIDALESSSERLENDLATMKLLGFSTLRGARIRDPERRARDKFQIATGSAYFHLTESTSLRDSRNNLCLNQPRTDLIHELLESNMREAMEETGGIPPVYVKIMDEPSSVTMEHMKACPVCREKFRGYCKGKGLAPEDLGVDTWEKVLPTDAKAARRLYYHSVNFRSQTLVDFFKLGTDILRDSYPVIKTAVNPSNELNFNMLQRGYDFYALLRQNALTYGLAEDWNNYAATYQVSGYMMDVLRSACRARGQPYGVYNILSGRTGWDIQAKGFSQIGQGARSIYFFSWSPLHSLTGDANSQRFEIYPALKQFNFAVGAAEDMILQSRPVASKIALLYSPSTDAWELGNEWKNVFTAERIGLDLLLRHLGYQLDVLDEENILEGLAKEYRVIILSASHLRRGVMPALLKWAAEGGLLYVSAGSAMYDQFNEPVDELAKIGLKREPLVFQQSPGRPRYEYRGLKLEGRILAGEIEMESFCAHQRLVRASGGTVLAKWADGGAAVCAVAHGRGRIVYTGFLPGIAYYRGGAIAKYERDRTEQEEAEQDADA